MTDDTAPLPDDVARIAADEALLDAVAEGLPVADGVGAMLAAWRDDLAAVVSATPTRPLPELQPAGRRWRRPTAGVAVAAVVVATSAGVAAAATVTTAGPLAPVHRLLYGDHPAHRADPRMTTTAALLAASVRVLDAAEATGGITAAQHRHVTDLLDRADAIASADADVRTRYAGRISQLREKLDALPLLAGPAADGDTDDQSPGEDADRGNGGGSHTGDDGDEGPSGDSGPGTGRETDSDDRSGPGDGSTSGDGSSSDDGSGADSADLDDDGSGDSSGPGGVTDDEGLGDTSDGGGSSGPSDGSGSSGDDDSDD